MCKSIKQFAVILNNYGHQQINGGKFLETFSLYGIFGQSVYTGYLKNALTIKQVIGMLGTCKDNKMPIDFEVNILLVMMFHC